MKKSIRIIGIIALFIICATGSAQVKVESNGSLFVNSSIGNWGKANWTKVHYQNTCAYHLFNTYYNMDVFYVNGDGRVWARQGYYTSSDEVFKTNIEDISDALSKVKKLRGVTYNRKYTIDSLVLKDGQNGNDYIMQIEKLEPKEYGLIAQEVKSVVPEVVQKMQDSTLAISYSSIIPILIEAIKEQQRQIDELQNTIEKNELKNQVLQNSKYSDGGFVDNYLNNNKLFQNVPNPFNERTKISFFIDNNSKKASLNIYNINGKLIKDVPIKGLGKGEIEIEGGELGAGVYIYSLIVDGVVVDSKQMMLTK